jgi:hypothetical protein
VSCGAGNSIHVQSIPIHNGTCLLKGLFHINWTPERMGQAVCLITLEFARTVYVSRFELMLWIKICRGSLYSGGPLLPSVPCPQTANETIYGEPIRRPPMMGGSPERGLDRVLTASLPENVNMSCFV